MRAAIYRLDTGEILRFVQCDPDFVDLQVQLGEELYLNCPDSVTHIVDGEPVVVTPPPSVLLNEIRRVRNAKLSACDWTQLPDSPLNAELRQAWAQYRQALRDFPAACDPENPVWPTSPTTT